MSILEFVVHSTLSQKLSHSQKMKLLRHLIPDVQYTMHHEKHKERELFNYSTYMTEYGWFLFSLIEYFLWQGVACKWPAAIVWTC